MGLNLDRYFKEIISKDETIGEEAWKSFPVPDDYKQFLFLRHFKNRFTEWKKSNFFQTKKINNILLLRPTLGFLIGFCEEMFPNAKIDYLDISKISQKTFGKFVAEAMAEFKRDPDLCHKSDLEVYEFLTAKIAEIIDMHYDGEL